MGDFNQGGTEFASQAVWRHHGWREAQELLSDQFGWEIVPTCKGSTVQDQIWLSPELASALKKVEVCDYFPTHSAVAAFFDFRQLSTHLQEWPMPAFIPWSKVELDQWHSSCAQSADWQWGSNLTEDFGKWCGRFESSLDGHGHFPVEHYLVHFEVGVPGLRLWEDADKFVF